MIVHKRKTLSKTVKGTLIHRKKRKASTFKNSKKVRYKMGSPCLTRRPPHPPPPTEIPKPEDGTAKVSITQKRRITIQAKK